MRKLIPFLLFSLTMTLNQSYSQVRNQMCQGVLGPPVVAINFGAGAANPGPALAPGITTYAYQTFCALNPNQYTIVNNTVNCNTGWWNILQDNTPNDVNGYFMLVDGANANGIFYTSVVPGLTPGFTYQFSAWGGNINNIQNNNVAPVVQFLIQDPTRRVTIAQSQNITLGYVSPFQWVQAGFTFQMPANLNSVAVTIILVSGTAAGGAGLTGNDLVIDDIEFAPCFPPITASFSSTTAVVNERTCNSGTVNLFGVWPQPTGNPFPTTNYQWQRSTDMGATWLNMPGGNTQNFSATESTPGVYMYRIFAADATDPRRSNTSIPITFRVLTLSVDPVSFDVYACNTSPTQISAQHAIIFDDPLNPLTIPYVYNWTPSTYLSSTSIKNPTITPPPQAAPNPAAPMPAPLTYTYQVSVSNSLGCFGQNTVTINYFNPRKVYVVSGFTPDGDGVNDAFVAINLEDYPGALLQVNNVWGNQVFRRTEPVYRWDGRFNGVEQPSGVYTWYVDMPFCKDNINYPPNSNGVSTSTVTLIR